MRLQRGAARRCGFWTFISHRAEESKCKHNVGSFFMGTLPCLPCTNSGVGQGIITKMDALILNPVTSGQAKCYPACSAFFFLILGIRRGDAMFCSI